MHRVLQKFQFCTKCSQKSEEYFIEGVLEETFFVVLFMIEKLFLVYNIAF